MSRTKPEGVLRLEANGHTLTGRRRKGVWNVQCADFPDLAGLHTNAGLVMALFLARSAEITVSPVPVPKE